MVIRAEAAGRPGKADARTMLMRGTTRVTGWRRIASALWDAPNDPQIFGALEVDAAPLLAVIERGRAAGVHVTPAHLVGRALAHALEVVPDLNAQIRRGRLRPRPTVDIFFITAVAGGHDLSGVKVVDVPHKTVLDVAGEVTDRSKHLKRGADREFSRTKKLSDATPPWLLRRLLRATAFLTEDLALDLPMLGLHRAPFGSAMITNVGTFGLPQGFAPIAWMYDVPVLVLVGELTDKAVVENGKVVARRVLPLTATIDHRYVDGWHVSKAMAAFRAYLATPDEFEPHESIANPRQARGVSAHLV
jgi:pyruvate dehydrogenase E2 component (dihydrolipoamide acetyltransferase)